MSKLFFGWATLAQADYLKALFGKVPFGFPATLNGYELCIQDFKDMPPLVQKVISVNWNPEEFKSFFVRKYFTGEVIGVAWEINEEQEAILDDWEFEGLWYSKDTVEIQDSKGKKYTAITYAINSGKGVVVPAKFDPFPVNKRKMLEIAAKNNLIARRARGEQ